MNNTWYFIVNPQAGGKRPARRLAKLKAALEASGLSFEMVLTQSKGHATVLCDKALEQGFRRFVVVGGDGSINEVLQSLAPSRYFQACTLTCLPWGTGNDWARQHRVPKQLKHFIRYLQQGKRRQQDIGCVNYGSDFSSTRFFINSVGCGFDCYLLEKMGSANGNLLRYYLYLVRCLFSYRAKPMHVRSPDKDYDARSFMLMACTNEFAGGGMRFAPNNDLNSKQLEFIDVQHMPFLQLLFSLPYLMNGKINSHKKVSYQRCKSFMLNSFDNEDGLSPSIDFQCDGEVVAQLPIKVACYAKKLNYLAP